MDDFTPRSIREREDDSDSADPELKRIKTEAVQVPVLSTDVPVLDNVEAAAPGDFIRRKGKSSSRRRDAAGYANSRRGKEKSGKNAGRRRGNCQSEPLQEAEGSSQLQAEQAAKAPRLPKRQCALLIGFCGTGCNGMQIQPNVRTIEGVLFEAMVKAGAVSQDNANDPSKVNLGRAARTDAGVHAAGNVVSIKMITVVPGIPDIIARINEDLPPEIRVWGHVRVQNSFNARLSCDSRKYTYFFPTYMLIPPKPGGNLYRTLQQEYPSTSSSSLTAFTSHGVHPFWANIDVMMSTREDDLRRKRQWRIGSDQVALIRESAKKFEGTHNFHNFTSGRDFSDKSNHRHMKKIEVSDPAVYGDTEWMSVMLHGQSFMLHQIRKMMTTLILSCRTGTPSRIIDEIYGPRSVNVPKMPSLGLLLEHPIFESYNHKVSGINEKLQPTDPEYRPPIDFDIHRDAMEKFKQEYIYDNMRAIEDRDGVFDAWIRTIDTYSGNDLLYLNPKGIIPPAAVVKRGEKRVNPFKDKKRFDATGFVEPKEDHTGGQSEEEVEEEVMKGSHLAETEG